MAGLLGSLLKGSKKTPTTAPAKLSLPAAVATLEEGEIPEANIRATLLSLLEKESANLMINRGYPRGSIRGRNFHLPGSSALVTVLNTRPAGAKTLAFKGDLTEPDFANRIHHLQKIPVYSESDFLREAPPGIYTWVLYWFRDDKEKHLHFAAMRVKSKMEYGTAHESIVRSIQESSGHAVQVLLAGEMRKEAGSVVLNLLSGSFTLKIIQGILKKYTVPGGAVFLNEHLTVLAQEIIQELLAPAEEGEVTYMGGNTGGKTYITVTATPITEAELEELRALDFTVTVAPTGAAGGAGAKMNLSGGGRRTRCYKRKGRKSRRLVRGSQQK